MHPIFVQTISYMVVLMIALLILSFLQRGFFWKFVRVKTSFGRLVLVKIRSVNRDHYSVAQVHENFIVFKAGDSYKRINVPDPSVFYRSLGVAWCDVDDSKNAIVKTNFEAVHGFDAVKYNNLYLRALYKPQIADTKEKLIIGAIVITMVLVGVALWLIYNQGNNIGEIKLIVQGLKSGTIVASGAL